VSIIDNRYDASRTSDARRAEKPAREEQTEQPVERRVFRDEIREKLIDGILSGRLPPGTRIVETRLAQQFGVSQAPVREALRDLALFGFVVSLPFRGARVRRITPDELLEIYPIRAALEGVAAAAAAKRIDDATLTRLEDLIATMRDAASRNDQRAQVDADGAFHHTIITAAGNRMLDHVWQTMRLSVTTCVTHSLTHRSLHEIAERHVPVLEALRARDPIKAEAAIRRHIEEPGEWILAAGKAEASAQPEQTDERPAVALEE
jgi:DNA-binding GntR family transcriptional regulator